VSASPKDQNHRPSYLLNTPKKAKNVHAGGISHVKTVPVVQRVNTSSVVGPCTSTATRRNPRVNLNMVAQEYAITSSPSQEKDIHVPQTIATKIVLGVPLAISSVLKTS